MVNFIFRYEYDDHYFLTDPREFIYEFFPLQEDWQLLKQPISLKDFEELPFVRSLFFRYVSLLGHAGSKRTPSIYCHAD